MKLFYTAILFGLVAGNNGYAQGRSHAGNEELFVKVRDVTHEYAPGRSSLFPTPTPVQSIPPTKPVTSSPPNQTYPGGFGYPSTGTPGTAPVTPPATDPLPPLPGGLTGGTTGGSYPTYPTYPSTGGSGRGVLSGGDHVTLGDLVTLGQKVWNFVISNKPNATYQTLKSSVVPSGITNWTQLRGWSKPVSKVYRVEFTNMFGMSAGSFDYRITFIYGGNYKGKGKYIGQISFVPANIHLATDRTLDVKAELLEPLNFGTEEDPVAGAELEISWSSPTTPRYQMSSVDLFLYGTGEIQNLSDGN